ncbi:MAG: EthD family reductase [Methylovirgula sp.]|uniref:EthD family reductase n=1 Tax=Methylovirgula sp. TaxID=1978224 RepID=UPI00307682A2
MSKLIVLYKKPADPAHFDKHFREVHVPLVKKMPGLRATSFGPASTLDGGEGAFFWIFIGTFDSLKAIHEALASPEGQKVVADIPNYSPDAPTILHLESTDG